MKIVVSICLLICLGGGNKILAQNNDNGFTEIPEIKKPTRQYTTSKYSSQKNNIPISISLYSDVGTLPDSMAIRVVYNPDELSPIVRDRVISNSAKSRKWIIESDRVVNISIPSLRLNNSFSYWLIEPGDNIKIDIKDERAFFSGKGSEKIKLGEEINSVLLKVKKPSNSYSNITKSLDDFVEFNAYLNNQLAAIEPILESYKAQISSDIYSYIKAMTIHRIEKERSNKFYMLYIKYCKEGLMSGVTSEKLSNIYDSVFFSTPAVWMRKQPYFFVGENEFYGFIRNQIIRKSNFSTTYSFQGHITEVFEEGKAQYEGVALEYFLTTTITDLIIHDFGFTPETEQIIEKYYNELKFEGYRLHVKEVERRAGEVYTGKWMPYFELEDIKGKLYDAKKLLGKLVLINFCFDECNECNVILKTIKDIQSEFKNDTNFILLNVISPETKNNFSLEKGVFLPIKEDYLLKAYGIYGCTGMRLIDPNGRIVIDPVPNLFTNRKDLSLLIKDNLSRINKNRWAIEHDGPYVLTEEKKMKAWYINKHRISKINLKQRKRISVNTDILNKFFDVDIKKKIYIEPSVYDKPSKLFVLSDIEGNFDALRNLLQMQNVIDDKFNWTFGTGHLVFIGDVVDRGNQVTECLWLIYALEDKAKNAGGYVHFILGNHEIMNMSGDIRYVKNKYTENASILKMDYTKDLYGQNAELGKWLRSKNIIEKIGDLLFVHGGISQEVNKLSLSIEKINNLARLYYDKESLARSSLDKRISMIFDTKLSPFWYREYYQKDSIKIGIGNNTVDTTFKTPKTVVEAVLTNYQINKIITGHTMYKIKGGDTGKYVSVHYDNKVINTDTQHAKGYSEALLIKEGKYYRVNKIGNKELLFSDN